MKKTDTYKLKRYEELFEAIDIGLDIEFFYENIRYNISWENKKPFICECPNGEAVFFKNTNELLCDYKIDGIPIKNLWDKLDIYSM